MGHVRSKPQPEGWQGSRRFGLQLPSTEMASHLFSSQHQCSSLASIPRPTLLVLWDLALRCILFPWAISAPSLVLPLPLLSLPILYTAAVDLGSHLLISAQSLTLPLVTSTGDFPLPAPSWSGLLASRLYLSFIAIQTIH